MSGDITRVEKPWGYELHWAKTDRYVGKIIHVNAGHALSLQYHNLKDETIYLHSGKQIYVEGRLQTRQWDDKDGNKRYTTEIRGDRIVLLGGGAGRGPSMDRGGDPGPGQAPGPDVAEPLTDDDIPF